MYGMPISIGTSVCHQNIGQLAEHLLTDTEEGEANCS